MPIVETREIVMRYCEDCKWFRKPKAEYFSPRCAHPLCDEGNRVVRNDAAAFCSMARRDFGTATSCGPDARYYEAKPIIEKTRSKSRLRSLIAFLRAGLT